VVRGRTVVVAALVVVLTGCTAPTGTPGAPTTGASGPTPMAPWTPSYSITLPAMSDAEAMERRAEQLAHLAETYELVDPPNLALVRWTTMSDYGVTMAECYRSAGFDALGGGNTVGFPGDSVGPAQQSAFRLADYECQSKYTLHPKYRQPFTEEQWEVFYDYWTQWLVPCLEGLGGHPPAPPTRETFVAQALQGKLAWDPWGSLQQTPEYASSIEKTVFLSQTCPQEPNVIWGG